MADFEPDVTPDQEAAAAMDEWVNSLESLRDQVGIKQANSVTLTPRELETSTAAFGLLNRYDKVSALCRGQLNLPTCKAFVTAAETFNRERRKGEDGEKLSSYLDCELNLIRDLKKRLGIKEDEKVIV